MNESEFADLTRRIDELIAAAILCPPAVVGPEGFVMSRFQRWMWDNELYVVPPGERGL